MKILCVCDEGNNRSVHFSHLLKYWGNDTIPIGLNNTSQKTLDMLYDWADVILLTEILQFHRMPEEYNDKIKVFEVGEDTYPRPFNSVLHKIVKQFLEDNKSWLKHK